MKRSRQKVIAGVCGGLAADMNLDPLLVRLAFLVASFFLCAPVLIYLVLWAVTDREE